MATARTLSLTSVDNTVGLMASTEFKLANAIRHLGTVTEKLGKHWLSLPSNERGAIAEVLEECKRAKENLETIHASVQDQLVFLRQAEKELSE